MENFRIDFTLSDPFPDGKKLGELGEKNAAQLIITPPENLDSREEIRSYVVAFSTGRGPVRYGPVTKSETITVPVGNALTVGSALSVQIEGYDSDGEFVIKSPVLSGIVLSGSIADCGCENNPDKNVIPGHMHQNLDVLHNLSDSDGSLTYKGINIETQKNIRTVELLSSKNTFGVLTDTPFYGTMILFSYKDKNGNPYVPDGVEILSVEFNMASEEAPEWVDIRDMIRSEPHIPYFINQHRTVDSSELGGVILSQITFVNGYINDFYEAANNYLLNGLRVKYIDKGGHE